MWFNNVELHFRFSAPSIVSRACFAATQRGLHQKGLVLLKTTMPVETRIRSRIDSTLGDTLLGRSTFTKCLRCPYIGYLVHDAER